MRPFYLDPSLENAFVLVICFNTQNKGHSGLGVNCLHTVRVLRKQGIRADMAAVKSTQELAQEITNRGEVTHCIIEAPWISTANMSDLLSQFPHTHFVMRVHSQVAFLQVEAGAVRLIREQMLLQESRLNFTVSANSNRLTHFLRVAYNGNCTHLPNLYDLDRVAPKNLEAHDHRLLRIGCFGALRLMKNPGSAAAAALLIARMRGCDLEFHINSNREEHGRGLVDMIRNLYANVPYATLVEDPWADWPSFRRIVSTMDLCLQPSMSETFNLVTADATAEHVPSAVCTAIEWVPPYWHVDIDDVDNIARVGSTLLSNQYAAQDGLNALRGYVNRGIQTWKDYLSNSPIL